MSRMLLAVVNESKRVAPAQVSKAVRACATQLKFHVAPAWGMLPPTIVYFRDKRRIPDSADVLTILDSADQSGLLGYHRQTVGGKPYARVFVNPIMNHGGELLTSAISVSAVMSHEICEWFVDPFLNLWADGPSGAYALEICDPVDEYHYDIDGISVSNFVFKAFYNPLAPASAQFDYLNKVKKPFTPAARSHIHIRNNEKIKTTGATTVGMRRLPAARSFQRGAHYICREEFTPSSGLDL